MTTAEKKSSLTYRDAGVDIDAGNRLVSLIRSAAESTRRPEVRSGLGGFGALFDLNLSGYRHPLLVSTTDGVGTKLKLAFLTQRHDTIGIDLVAMSVNDLIVQGAEPLFFLDYFATGKLSPETAATVITGIAQGCQLAGCSLVGGETAEMPGFYPEGEYDLAGFAVGIVEKDALIDGSHIQPGNTLIGLASSGPHSNGYSLIRRLVLPPHGPGLDTPYQNSTLGEALLTPTRIYVQSILALKKELPIHGLVHITGGGFWDNIPRVLPNHCAAHIIKNAWPRPTIFNLLQNLGPISEYEMLRTFNCGIGMVIVLPADACDQAMSLLTRHGEQPFILGQITQRTDSDQPQVVIDE